VPFVASVGAAGERTARVVPASAGVVSRPQVLGAQVHELGRERAVEREMHHATSVAAAAAKADSVSIHPPE